VVILPEIGNYVKVFPFEGWDLTRETMKLARYASHA